MNIYHPQLLTIIVGIAKGMFNRSFDFRVKHAFGFHFPIKSNGRRGTKKDVDYDGWLGEDGTRVMTDPADTGLRRM